MAKTTPFDAAEYLDNPEIIAEYIAEALETNDLDVIACAVGSVAKAEGMTHVAREAGLSRENLYKSLGSGGKPEFSTVMKVLNVLGVQLTAKPMAHVA